MLDQRLTLLMYQWGWWRFVLCADLIDYHKFICMCWCICILYVCTWSTTYDTPCLFWRYLEWGKTEKCQQCCFIPVYIKFVGRSHSSIFEALSLLLKLSSQQFSFEGMNGWRDPFGNNATNGTYSMVLALIQGIRLNCLNAWCFFLRNQPLMTPVFDGSKLGEAGNQICLKKTQVQIYQARTDGRFVLLTKTGQGWINLTSATARKWEWTPLKMDGWNTIISMWGPAYFQGRTVSLREGNRVWENFFEHLFLLAAPEQKIFRGPPKNICNMFFTKSPFLRLFFCGLAGLIGVVSLKGFLVASPSDAEILIEFPFFTSFVGWSFMGSDFGVVPWKERDDKVQLFR